MRIPPTWFAKMEAAGGVIAILVVLGLFVLFAMGYVALNGAPL